MDAAAASREGHLWRALAALLTALGLAGPGAWGSTYSFAKLPLGVELGDYAYRFAGRGRVKDFVLEVALQTTAAGPAARILFGYQDERNHYYAEASDTNCIFVKVEDGIERRIGTPSSAQVARNAAVRLALVRRRHTMGLWMDGRQVAEAYDATFPAGRVALAPRSDSATLDTVRLQRVGDVRFADDFMRTDAEQTAWETVAGTWQLKSLPSASLSANAFMFTGAAGSTGAGALAVRGHWFWHNYVLTAACRPAGGEAVGLAFTYRDPKTYHLLRWEAQSQGNRLQLLRVDDGRRHVLGTAAVGFTPGQWYQLKVCVVGQRATAFVDGNPVLEVTDPHLLTGSVGLYCEGTAGALFDDVEVSVPLDFVDDFEREIKGKWTALGGTWTRQAGSLEAPPDGRFLLAASAQGEGRYVSGESQWSDYTTCVDARPGPGGELGLVAHYQDEANYYLLQLSREGGGLVRVAQGERTELARHDQVLALDGAHRLELAIERGVLTGRLDGRVLLRACDTALRHGRAGLFIKAAEQTAFDDFAVTMPRRPRELFTDHDVFAAEESMAKWAVQQSDWLSATETLGGKEQTVQWHRADCLGDVEVEAKLAKVSDGGRAWIVLAADGKSVATGYRVHLARAGDQYTVAIKRGAKTVAEKTLQRPRPPERFSAQRIAHAVLAVLDGEVVLAHGAPRPPEGSRVAWVADGTTPAENGVNILSRSVVVYSFHKAPVDWRALAGEWEVTNRWHCDPRWSFFAGERRGGKLVAIWNKRRFGPEVTLEFAAGIRHDPDRGHTNYVYASDINAVVCGDGADLRQGYNFVFGGWSNQHTRILRNGEVVATTSKALMPGDSSQHRYWFYIKIQKRGGQLRFFVDNELVLEYSDPEPLTGDRVAVWTWDNDLMVARVRIAAPQFAPCERPVGPPPDQPPCIYR